MTVDEISARAKFKAEDADAETLVSLFEGAVESYHSRLMNSSQESADKAYARYEVYREELLKRLGE